MSHINQSDSESTVTTGSLPSPSPNNVNRSTAATHPFDDIEADVVLRSSDHVDFHVYKAVMLLSSPFFRSMFTLPQPGSAAAGSEKDITPIIPVSETHDVLDIVLRICYPSPLPGPLVSEDLHMVSNVLEVGRKYQMESVVDYAKERLKNIAQHDPIRVYAIACQLGAPDVAQEAAKMSLRLPMGAFCASEVAELDGISGRAFQRLLAYWMKCRDTAVDCVSAWSWVYTRSRYIAANAPFWTSQHGTPCEGVKYLADSLGKHQHAVAEWWYAYMQELAKSLRDQPWDGKVTHEDMFAAYLSKSSGCLPCLKNSFKHTRDFAIRLSAEIRRRQSEVALDIGHIHCD